MSVRVATEELRPYFTLKVLAQYMAMSERKVRYMLAAGEIPSHRLSGRLRIYADDVDAFVAACRSGMAPQSSRPAPGAPPFYPHWEEDERAYAAVLVNDPCCYCGGTMEAVDHIVPLARGGEHSWKNFTAACRHCNTRKWAYSLLWFLGYRGRRK